MSRLNKYKLKAKIVVRDKQYTVVDIQSAYSDKQARFEFYQRIKGYFKLDAIKFADKVSCKLVQEGLKKPILDLIFKNFEVSVNA